VGEQVVTDAETRVQDTRPRHTWNSTSLTRRLDKRVAKHYRRSCWLVKKEMNKAVMCMRQGERTSFWTCFIKNTLRFTSFHSLLFKSKWTE